MFNFHIFRDQPWLVGNNFLTLDNNYNPVQLEQWSLIYDNGNTTLSSSKTAQAESQTESNPEYMISSLNMASSGYLSSSAVLDSPMKESGIQREFDSIDDQLSNLTLQYVPFSFFIFNRDLRLSFVINRNYMHPAS